jgi:hypothetical protein
MNELILEDGKYRFYIENYTVKCDRYGEPWRDFVGDKAIYALLTHAIDLQQRFDTFAKDVTSLLVDNALMFEE